MSKFGNGGFSETAITIAMLPADGSEIRPYPTALTGISPWTLAIPCWPLDIPVGHSG